MTRDRLHQGQARRLQADFIAFDEAVAELAAQLVAALAASAWGIWTYVIPHHADIPALAGDSVAAAQSQLDELGFAVRIADGQYSERIAADHVLRVQPSPGTSLELGETVTLVPSLGPPPVAIPSIEGKTLEQARHLLQKAGLTLGEPLDIELEDD